MLYFFSTVISKQIKHTGFDACELVNKNSSSQSSRNEDFDESSSYLFRFDVIPLLCAILKTRKISRTKKHFYVEIMLLIDCQPTEN